MSTRKRILITGTNGMLGKDVLYTLKKTTRFELFGLNRTKDLDLDEKHSIVSDLEDKDKLIDLVAHIRPHIIIHCAALTNINLCEENKDKAYRINVEATNLLSKHSHPDTKMIYVSTDSIFEGDRGNFSVKDEIKPLNYYSKTKYFGEQKISTNKVNSIIIRTNIYGFHKEPGESLFEWAIKEFENQNSINGFDDVLFNPLYTKQLAILIKQLIDKDLTGVYHAGVKEKLSKYEFLVKLALKFGYNPDYYVKKSCSDSIGLSVKRPKNTTLDTTKVEKKINIEFNIDEGINELYVDYIKFQGVV